MVEKMHKIANPLSDKAEGWTDDLPISDLIKQAESMGMGDEFWESSGAQGLEGLKKLKEELAHLEQVERPRVSQEIADARDKGDLSENAEYHAAKEEQSLLETKIAKLKNVVANARVIDESQLDTSKILIHSIVKIKNTVNGMEFTYTLVADSESDVRNGKLSVNSPIGKGLLGKKVGDVAEIQVPNGIMKFEVMEISR